MPDMLADLEQQIAEADLRIAEQVERVAGLRESEHEWAAGLDLLHQMIDTQCLRRLRHATYLRYRANFPD